MPRTRYLKPEFFKDVDLAEHPYWIRLLYEGLWGIADKEGRLKDNSKWIKAEVFPYDNEDVEKGLMILASTKSNSPRPFIQRYEVKGEKYIQILKWQDHQKPHHTEKESEIPEPSSLKTTLNISKDKVSVKDVSAPLDNGEITVKERLFEDIWKKYPSKVGRKEALRHFVASVRTDKDQKDIHIALRNYLLSERVSKGFIQDGSKWFNQWRDWIDPPEKKGTPRKQEPSPSFKPGETRYNPNTSKIAKETSRKMK